MNTTASITTAEFASSFRVLAAAVSGRLDQYPAWRSSQLRAWGQFRGRRPHLDLPWENELLALHARYRIKNISIGGFTFTEYDESHIFRTKGEPYLQFAQWERIMLTVRQDSDELYFADVQDCVLQGTGMPSNVFLSYLLSYAEFQVELTTEQIPTFDEVASKYLERANMLFPHAIATRMFSRTP